MTAILKKELQQLRVTLPGYIFTAFILAVTGLYFSYTDLNLASPRFEDVLKNLLFVFVIFIPLFTMRSLAEELGSTDFARIRVGTGDRPKGQDLAAWVLGHYSAEEKARMEKAFDRAAECAAIWAEEGLRSAMQFGNAPTEEKTAEKKEEAKEEEKKA